MVGNQAVSAAIYMRAAYIKNAKAMRHVYLCRRLDIGLDEYEFVDVMRSLAGDILSSYTWWSQRGRAFDNKSAGESTTSSPRPSWRRPHADSFEQCPTYQRVRRSCRRSHTSRYDRIRRKSKIDILLRGAHFHTRHQEHLSTTLDGLIPLCRANAVDIRCGDGDGHAVHTICGTTSHQCSLRTHDYIEDKKLAPSIRRELNRMRSNAVISPNRAGACRRGWRRAGLGCTASAGGRRPRRWWHAPRACRAASPQPRRRSDEPRPDRG